MKLLKSTWNVLKFFLLTVFIIFLLAVAATFIFQDKIIQLTFSALNQHLSTKIEIDKDVKLSIIEKFPEISIKVKNVKIQEAVTGSDKKLADIGKLYFTFNAFDFIKGRYVINNIYVEGGEIRIAIDEKGKGNYFIFKSDSGSSGSVSFDLQKIILNDVLLKYDNLALKQLHEIHIEKTTSSLKFDSSWHIGLNGDLFVHSITIEGNEYLKDKKVKINAKQEYITGNRIFKIEPSDLLIEGSEFKVSGFYQGNGTIDLDIKAAKSSIGTLISLLPKNVGKALHQYKSSGNIFFEAKIAGQITATESPDVNVNFGFSNASFFHPDIDKKVEKATLTGSFSNGKNRCLKSSILNLNDVNALFDGKMFKGNFSVENFEDPYIQFDCVGTADISSMLKLYPNKNIENGSGNISMDISFSGKVSDLKTKEGKERINGRGSISLENVNFDLKEPNISYKNISGSFSFNKNDLIINELNAVIGNSDISVKGEFKNFVNKFLLDKHALMVNAEVKSKHLDIEQLLSLLTKEDQTDEKEPQGKRYPYLEDYKFKLKCDIATLKYHKLNARSVKGEVEFDQPGAFLKNISLQTAGGKIILNSTVYFKTKEVIEVNTKADLSNIYIDSVFYISENFGQDFIQDKNLKGQFNGNIQLFFVMDHNLDINSSSVIATIDASILNGELNQFEPMKKLSKFVDVKELENIRFSELRNKIFIENRKVVIPEMEIKSNISNITVMGTHTFDQQMDYKLRVPLKNLKKNQKDKDEAFGAIEEDNKGNSTVFLIIKGTSDNYKISYDTKRTGQKIKEDLKKEKKELENLFKKKEEEQTQELSQPDEVEYFDF